MWVHFQMAWTTGWRNRAARLIFCIGLVALVAAWVSGVFSGRQPQTVALDVGLSLLRVFALLLVLYWVHDLFAREIDQKIVFLPLSYPLPRSAYLVGRWLAVLALAAVSVVFMALSLLVVSWVATWGYQQSTPVAVGVNYLVTVGGMLVDLMVIAAFAMLVAVVSTTPFFAFFAGLGFAALARAWGPTMDLLLRPETGVLNLSPAYLYLLDAARWALPDLSRLDIRSSALYGLPVDWPTLGLAIVQALAYLGILLLAAVQLFSRKQFS